MGPESQCQGNCAKTAQFCQRRGKKRPKVELSTAKTCTLSRILTLLACPDQLPSRPGNSGPAQGLSFTGVPAISLESCRDPAGLLILPCTGSRFGHALPPVRPGESGADRGRAPAGCGPASLQCRGCTAGSRTRLPLP